VRNLSNTGIKYSVGYRPGTTGAAGASGATFGAEVNGTSNWQTASVTVTHTGEEGATIYLRAVNAGAQERAGFDRVTIEEVTPVGPPTISRNPASFNRTIDHGAMASSDVFTIQNTGGGTLSYTITDNAAWLGVVPASGTSAGEADVISINYTTAALTPGQHIATITISDPNATNNPQTIAVTLNITAPPVTGDEDGDGDVDMSDFGKLQACLSGPGITQPAAPCQWARLDGDDDVDNDDAVLLRGCLSGASIPASPGCAAP
jgi:hypothetical protein